MPCARGPRKRHVDGEAWFLVGANDSEMQRQGQHCFWVGRQSWALYHRAPNQNLEKAPYKLSKPIRAGDDLLTTIVLSASWVSRVASTAAYAVVMLLFPSAGEKDRLSSHGRK